MDRTRNRKEKMQDFDKLPCDELIHKFNNNKYIKDKWFE